MAEPNPLPSDDGAPDAGVAFVLRCRRESGDAASARLHINLQRVGEERRWRFTDLDQAFALLRAEISRLLGEGGEARENSN